jgi:hypothetical protein
LGGELRWGDATVGVLDEDRDLAPVDGDVEVDAEPAFSADLGWSEVSAGIGGDEGLLCTLGSGAPEGDAVVVMMVGVHDEALLVADIPHRLAVGEALGDLRKCGADVA